MQSPDAGAVNPARDLSFASNSSGMDDTSRLPKPTSRSVPVSILTICWRKPVPWYKKGNPPSPGGSPQRKS